MHTRGSSRGITALIMSLLAVASLALASCARSPKQARPTTTQPTTTTTTTVPPPAVSPLTGLPPGPAGLDRRALMFKIDNEPGAAPQAGLEAADVVYEEMIEGDDTRFVVVVQSKDAPLVGPIRSARPLDVVLAKSLGNPLLAFSGAAANMLKKIEAGGVELRVDDRGDKGFYTDGSRKGWHNLFTSSNRILATLTTKTGPPPPQWQFSTAPLAAGATASTVAVAFPGKTVTWGYDPGSARYVRQKSTGAVTRNADGSPIAFANLVVTEVAPLSTGLVDAAGNPEQDWQVVGTGRAWVARGGLIVQGTWSRPAEGAPAKLLDANGQEIALVPGTTWWSLLPQGGTVTAS